MATARLFLALLDKNICSGKQINTVSYLWLGTSIYSTILNCPVTIGAVVAKWLLLPLVRSVATARVSSPSSKESPTPIELLESTPAILPVVTGAAPFQITWSEVGSRICCVPPPPGLSLPISPPTPKTLTGCRQFWSTSSLSGWH